MLKTSLGSLLLLAPLAAQESYWVANRASLDIMEVSPWGSVVQRVATPTTLRSAHVAPDGKVWIVRFGATVLDIFDPATATFTPVTSLGGAPFQIAFDAQGTAWVSGGTAVQNFSSGGVHIQTYAMPVAAPLGITIDGQGNKWIAQRTTPASVTRIDPTGTITNFPITGATMLPTGVIADFRGVGQPSRIWVTGDSAPQLAELDANGNTLNVYTYTQLGANGGGTVFDKAGDIWVSSFSNGALLQIDPTNGTVRNAYSFPPSINGLTVDSLGRLVATARVTFSGVGPPCELRRINPANGQLEVPTFLQFGTFSSTGTQSPASTPFQYATVVAPLGDMDGDGEQNLAEILNNTSPIDAGSNSEFRVESFGITSIGSNADFGVQASASTLWVLVFATARGTPLTIPGLSGQLRLDPATLLFNVSGFASSTLGIGIPATPSLRGFELLVQGVVASGANPGFRNVSGMKLW